MVSSMLLLVALVSLAGIAGIWFLALRRPAQAGARCGQCGYRVEGLQALSCPECGGDFRTVGILASRRTLIRPPVFIVLWTLLLPWPALLASRFVLLVVPADGRVTATFEVGTPSPALPAIEIVQTMRAVVPRRGGLSVTGPQVSTVEEPGRPSTTTVAPVVVTGPRTLDVVGFTLSPVPGPGGDDGPPCAIAVNGGVPDAGDLARLQPWLRSLASPAAEPTGDASNAAAVDPAADDALDPAGATDLDVTATAADLAAMLSCFAARGQSCTLQHVTLVGTSVTAISRVGYPGWIGPVQLAFWAAVYVAGILLYVRVHLRRTRQVAPAGGTPALTGTSPAS